METPQMHRPEKAQVRIIRRRENCSCDKKQDPCGGNMLGEIKLGEADYTVVRKDA